mgnify:CR=1 FL=1
MPRRIATPTLHLVDRQTQIRESRHKVALQSCCHRGRRRWYRNPISYLAKMGLADVCLIERSVLTTGSSWHAAGGIHALNADPNIVQLQGYTIDRLS